MNIAEQIIFLTVIYYTDNNLVKLNNIIKKKIKSIKLIKVKNTFIKKKYCKLQKNKQIKNVQIKNLYNTIEIEKNSLAKLKHKEKKIQEEKEYKAFILEIKNKKQNIIKYENKILQKMEDINILNVQIKNKKNIIYNFIRKINHPTIKQKFYKTKNKYKNLIHYKKKQLKSLNISTKKKYIKIFNQRKKQAFAYLINNICQICMQYIPSELAQKIGMYRNIEQCPSCNRFLLINLKILTKRIFLDIFNV